MKKAIAITLALIVAIGGIMFFVNKKYDSDNIPTTDAVSEDNSITDIFSLQYRIYAPKHCLVTLDGKTVPYNDTLNCYVTQIKRHGKHPLTVSREGCVSFEKEISADKDNCETDVDLEYTAEFLSEAETKAKELLTDIINKCWHLDGDLSSYNFFSEKDKADVDSVITSVIGDLEAQLSAEYSTGDLSLNMITSQNSAKDALCLHDSEENPIMVSFMAEYTYSWEYESEAYTDSGVQSKIHKPHIVIEKIDGVWYIRDLYLSLSNSSI